MRKTPDAILWTQQTVTHMPRRKERKDERKESAVSNEENFR